MESFFSRFKNALVLIAILLAQIVALATQVNRPVDPRQPDGRNVRLIRLWASALVTPSERLSHWSGTGLRGAWSNYVALRHVRQQNVDLQHQIAQLRLERAALAEDALEGHRLSGLMNFREHYLTSTVVAQVLGTSGSDQSRILLLDKGSDDGLKPGMPVVTPDGVVGRLRDVFKGTSQLLLLNDPTSGAGIMLQSTRIRAVLRGSTTGQVQITNLTADDRIKPGETVLTSGGDQVFPRGLTVGTISKIVPDVEHPPYSLITLKPAADLNRLEEVLIVTGTGAVAPGTEEELAADAAARHAAEVGAERLPSVDAPPPADPDTPPPANNSTGLVPKPKAVLAPDRYSPGAAPPAADLTPGGKKP